MTITQIDEDFKALDDLIEYMDGRYGRHNWTASDDWDEYVCATLLGMTCIMSGHGLRLDCGNELEYGYYHWLETQPQYKFLNVRLT